MLVSYKMERLGSGDTERYIVTMVIKSKRGNDEGHMLSLMQEWPDVTVDKSNDLVTASLSCVSSNVQAYLVYASADLVVL